MANREREPVKSSNKKECRKRPNPRTEGSRAAILAGMLEWRKGRTATLERKWRRPSGNPSASFGNEASKVGRPTKGARSRRGSPGYTACE